MFVAEVVEGLIGNDVVVIGGADDVLVDGPVENNKSYFTSCYNNF